MTVARVNTTCVENMQNAETLNETQQAKKNQQVTQKTVSNEDSCNTVSQDTGGEASKKASNDPTEGSREATNAQCSSTGYASTAMDDLKNNADYKDLENLINLANQLESGGGLYAIDQDFAGALNWGKGDGIINWGNIEEAAEHGCGTTKAAAKMLHDNPRLFHLIDADGNGEINGKEVRSFIASCKAKKLEMEKTAKEADKAAEPPPAKETPPTDSEQAPIEETKETKPDEPSEVEKQIDATTPHPEPSKLAGMDGAAENMNNMLGWTEAEISRLSELYTQTDDPAVQKKIENKMNALSRMAQQVAAMLNQIMTLMSNISKMQSDIAMNSIRNIR